MENKYNEITQQIESNLDLTSIPQETLLDWKAILEQHIQELKQIGDLEGTAIAIIQLTLFNLKSKIDSNNVEENFNLAINTFTEAEKNYEANLEKFRNTDQKQLITSQFKFFYKISEYYLSILEKTCLNYSKTDLGKQVSDQKIKFIKKHLLLQENILRYLDYNRLSFQSMIHKHMLLFAILSAIGIVLLWHGLWGIFDWIIGKFGLTESIFPYLMTSIFGALVLYILGVFVELTSGDPKDVTEELKDAAELQSIEKVIEAEN